jgi:transposase, IS30 family
LLEFQHEKNKHKRLNRYDRNEIHELVRKKWKQQDIADRLGVTQGAVSGELNHNTRKGRLYDAKYAHHKSRVNRKYKHARSNTIALHPELKKTIEEYLFDDQSPEHISQRIRKYRKDLPYVSGVTMRTYIKSVHGRRIEAHRNKVHHKRRGKRKMKFEITDKRLIDKRPLYIKHRKRIGDTEGDFIVSGHDGEGYLFVCTDRKSRAPFLEKIDPVSIRCVENGIGRIKKRFPELKTMTFDNDILFIHHKVLEKKFGIKIYFCHKHSPWEKPQVENRNKIIRHYIPKGSDISRYTKKYIQKLEDKLQRQIMKCLDYRTPKEILERHRKRKKKQ